MSAEPPTSEFGPNIPNLERFDALGRERGALIMADSHQRMCTICLDTVANPVALSNACSHFFHAPCFSGWANSVQAEGDTASCPVCKAPMDAVNVQEIKELARIQLDNGKMTLRGDTPESLWVKLTMKISYDAGRIVRAPTSKVSCFLSLTMSALLRKGNM